MAAFFVSGATAMTLADRFPPEQARLDGLAAVARASGGDRQRHGRLPRGRGIAGARTRPLRVTIFGAEPRVNYNRIMLSPVLAGEKSFDEIVINDADGMR
jgi:hypothetical protein